MEPLPEIYFLGNATRDIRILHDRVVESPGGPPTFSLPLLCDFFPTSRITLFSSGKRDSVEHLQRYKSVNIALQESSDTTTFELDYREEPRKLTLLKVADELDAYDVLRRLSNTIPKIIFCNSVYREISDDLIIELHRRFPGTPIILDAQGFVRSRDPIGTVQISDWNPPKGLLQSITLLKISREELTKKTLSLLTEDNAPNTIITLGAEGSLFIDKSEGNSLFTHFPALPIDKAIDVTGAGDIFLAGAGIAYSMRNNVQSAISFGTALVWSVMSGSKKKEFGSLVDIIASKTEEISSEAVKNLFWEN